MKLDLKALLAKITGQAEFKTLLWTNSTAFSSVNIPVDRDAYDFLDVEVQRYGNIQTIRIPTTSAQGEIYAMYDSYQTVRTYTLNATTLSFANGAYFAGYLNTTRNYGTNYCVPTKVYGVKLVGGN